MENTLIIIQITVLKIISAKIIICTFTRARLLCQVCYETPCTKYGNNEDATIGSVVHRSFDSRFVVICLKILHTEFFISCLWPFWGNPAHPLQPFSSVAFSLTFWQFWDWVRQIKNGSKISPVSKLSKC